MKIPTAQCASWPNRTSWLSRYVMWTCPHLSAASAPPNLAPPPPPVVYSVSSLQCGPRKLMPSLWELLRPHVENPPTLHHCTVMHFFTKTIFKCNWAKPQWYTLTFKCIHMKQLRDYLLIALLSACTVHIYWFTDIFIWCIDMKWIGLHWSSS